jgi:hypothetical protein
MSKELYSDSDVSSESECDLDEEETTDSDGEEVDPTEPKLSVLDPDVETFWTLEA